MLTPNQQRLKVAKRLRRKPVRQRQQSPLLQVQLASCPTQTTITMKSIVRTMTRTTLLLPHMRGRCSRCASSKRRRRLRQRGSLHTCKLAKRTGCCPACTWRLARARRQPLQPVALAIADSDSGLLMKQHCRCQQALHRRRCHRAIMTMHETWIPPHNGSSRRVMMISERATATTETWQSAPRRAGALRLAAAQSQLSSQVLASLMLLLRLPLALASRQSARALRPCKTATVRTTKTRSHESNVPPLPHQQSPQQPRLQAVAVAAEAPPPLSRSRSRSLRHPHKRTESAAHWLMQPRLSLHRAPSVAGLSQLPVVERAEAAFWTMQRLALRPSADSPHRTRSRNRSQRTATPVAPVSVHATTAQTKQMLPLHPHLPVASRCSCADRLKRP